uniref:Fibronectin type-III domain-containing protein n=1 Tax=Amphimedon queenslandica TaxID=400682 RepID=A0A1X7U7U2_AMPQE
MCHYVNRKLICPYRYEYTKSLFVLYTGVIVCAVFSSIQLCGVIMASALLLGLILCAGLTSGDVTHFQCTNGSVCAGGRVECNCTTSTGAIDWTISYRVLGSSNQSWTTSTFMFNKGSNTNNDTEYEYNFTYDEINNSSKLNFYLNASENIFIVCKNGNVSDNESTIIRDSGYYAKAPTNLTTTFNANGVTLQWEDTGNNCTSTVYQVTVNGTSNSVLTSYNNSKTTLLIHSSELNTTETYTYTVRGWNGQQSNISKPFTLAPHEVMNITINTTNTTDPCKNSCCANVTLNIILESLDPYVKHPSQYHNISYNSNTGNIPVTYEVTGYDETKWTGSGLKYNETYCFTVTPMNNFSTGMPISNDTTTQYSCEPTGNSGDNGDDKPEFMLLNTVALLLGVELILLYSGLGDCAITNFQCTDGPVCAGDRIECSCTTDTGTLEWFVKYSPVESLMWNQIPQVSFHAMNTEDKEFYGYNFTFNTTYTGLNTSILTFNLNHSQSVLIECANGQETDKMNTTVTDLGYYAKAPTNLTTTFNASRITLEWEDTGNNCTSTEYQVTVISCSCTSTSVLTYSTNDTALHINSRDLLDNITYTYTVRGWNEQQSNNSKPFTLSNDAITFQCESPQNNNDLAFNVTITANSTTDDCSDSCCTNITISIRLVLNTSDPQYANLSYNISYDSITGIEESMVKSEGEWNKFIQLPRNETHYFDSRQAKMFLYWEFCRSMF